MCLVLWFATVAKEESYTLWKERVQTEICINIHLNLWILTVADTGHFTILDDTGYGGGEEGATLIRVSKLSVV